MKLSMRSEYGARAVLDLARYYNQGPIQSADIAARQEIPEAYLEQLLTTLRKSGLIRSTRGPHGGHELAHPPSEVRLAAVITALEGPLVPGEAPSDDGAASVGCGLREIWCEVMQAAQQILDGVSIQDLVDRQQARESRPMYHI